MEKLFDYEIKGDQRIKIKYNKLFSPVRVIIDGEEVYKFSDKKSVFYGDKFTYENDTFVVRYVKSEDGFAVSINGIYVKGSAGQPNAFLKKLVVGPLLFFVLGLIFTVIIVVKGGFAYGLTPLGYLIIFSMFVRGAIVYGLLKRIEVFYIIGIAWFSFEAVIDVLTVISNEFAALGGIFFKALVLYHFYSKKDKYKKLKEYNNKIKNKDTSQVIDQF